MTNFPTSPDAFPAAATLAGHTLSSDPHSTLHGNLGDALAAVEVWLLAALSPSTFLLTLTGNASLSGTNTGDQDLSGYVPTSRTVNGHPLSANVTVSTLRRRRGVPRQRHQRRARRRARHRPQHGARPLGCC